LYKFWGEILKGNLKEPRPESKDFLPENIYINSVLNIKNIQQSDLFHEEHYFTLLPKIRSKA